MTNKAMLLMALMLFGSAASAAANPAMLPKHPGYPSSGDFANDTGQNNLTHEQSLLGAADAGSAQFQQQLVDPNNARLVKPQGAGRLPIVDGPNILIEPPVKEGTRMPSK
ncbi:MAG: hypothetical protein OJF52_000476 [Nitrospira sp.]|jgi:hypothetical protein|nr:MAG: hypothetical protein OJF52_000476 [Nitrospira sp.]